MTSYNPPVKNQTYIVYAYLRSRTDPNVFQNNPTLATGDAKVSVDGGALANLATLPTVTPAGGKQIKITLSSSEMNGDNVSVVLSDAAGDEWSDWAITLQTVAAGRQFDNLSTLTAAQVNAEADTALADYDAPTHTELTAALAALNNISTAQVYAQAAAALAAYDGPTYAELVSELAGLNDLDAATVKAKLVEALSVDGYGEPGAVPGATATIVEMLAWMKALTINEDVQTATTRTVKTSGGSGTLGSAAVSRTPSAVTRGQFS
jgi:hypothetical protein